MSTLTGKLVADTYKALLKLIDNDVISATEKQVSDGFGGGTGLFIDQNGFIRANKFRVSGANSSQFLKGDGSIDSTSYLSVASAASTYLPIGSTTSAIAEGSRLYFTQPRVLSTPLTGFVSTSGTVTSSDTVLTSIEKIWWNIVNGGGGGGGGYVPYVGATQNLNLGTYGLISDFLQFNISPTSVPTSAGTMSWDNTDGTANLKLKGNNVNLHVGQDSVARVVNGTGGNVLRANYQVVKITGAQGQRLQISLSQANNDFNSKDTIGLICENINNNQEGFVLTNGILDEINTTGSLQSETWVDGDTLYLSGLLPGRLTNIKPQAPTHTVIVGFVVYAHQNHGKIFVKVDNGYELDELHNVQITSVADKNILVYDSTSMLWQNQNIFGTQGYLPYYDNNLLMKDSVIFTNGTNVGIGATTLTEKLVVNGNILANQFKRVGGLSTQFLKADGSIDSTQYQPYSADLTAIDALALTTGLLRKNGTDTWELDQTEYISLAFATSTYQTYANLSSNLTASATKYPSVNAVNSGLALKLNLTGGTLTGGLTLNYSYPTIALSDISSGTIWNIQNDGSTFKLNYGATNKFYIFSSGNAAFSNDLTANALIKAGGTSSQFLKADGSVDSTNYQPYDADLAAIAALALTTGLLRKNGMNTWELDQTEYLSFATANSTFQTLANLSNNLTASSTKYPSVNAVNTGLNLRLALTGGSLSGDLAISKSIPTLQLSDTSSGTIWNIQNDGGGFEINSGTTNKFVMYSSGNATFVNDLTANKFIKSGGTSSQFLMADGSVSSGNAGTVTSVGLSAPTGFSVSGSPVTTSGTLALAFSAGYSLPTISSQGNWDTAYNRSLTSIGVSGTTTKTLTLTKQDGTTLTASWSDINTDAVTSVFGRTGAIVATSGDYTTAQVTESGNLYYTDARARASISGVTGISYNSTTGVITNTITQYTDALARASLSFVAGSGAYNSTTGVITIPTNNNQITNGAGYITGITSGMVTTALGYTPVTNARTLTINGTTYDLSADRSWTISGTIGGLTSGYIPKATSASTLGNSLLYDNGTNVGIGTTSPATKLEISQTTDNTDGPTLRIANNANTLSNGQLIGAIDFYNGDDSGTGNAVGAYIRSYMSDGVLPTSSQYLSFATGGTTERMRLDSAGNLGLGVTPSAWGSTSYKAIQGNYGTSYAFDQNVPTAHIVSNAYNNGTNWIYQINAPAARYIVNGWTSEHIWYTAPSGTAGNAISFTQAMTLDASGNLMVNTTSPIYSASNRGNITIGGSSGSILSLGTSTASNGYLYYDSTNIELANSNPSGLMKFVLAGSERMRITNTGNVGIGTSTFTYSSSTRGYLAINGSSDSLLEFQNGGSSSSYLFSNSSYFEINAVGSRFLYFTTNSSERARITSGGNFLIGTSTDLGYKLDVNGTGRFSGSLTINQTAFTFGSGLNLLNWQLVSGGDSGLYIGYSGTTRLSIASTGAATFASSVTATRYYITPNGSNPVYNIVNSDSTYAGSYIIQAGGGSAGFGGGLITYGHSHATKPGWVTAGISVGSGGKFSVNNQGLGGGTDLFVVESSTGNVGIGTTSQSSKLTIQSNSTQLRLETASDPSGYYSFIESNYNAANPLNIYSSGAASYAMGTISLVGITGVNTYLNSYYGIIFGTSASSISSGTVRGMITNGGNWLIGTTTDSGDKLYVNGTLSIAKFNATASSGGYITIQKQATDQLYVGSSTAISGVGTNADIWATSGNGLSFYTNGSTSNFFRLSTTGAATFSSSVSIPSLSSGNGAYYFGYSGNTSSRSWRIANDVVSFGDFSIQQSTTQTGTTYSSLLYINPSGNVGIGSSSPGYRLQVDGASTAGFVTSIVAKNPSTNAASAVKIGFDAGGTIWGEIGASYNSNNPYLGFYVRANSEKMRITDGGNVLIGTTTDSGYKLDVNGTGRFSSSLYMKAPTGVGTFISFTNDSNTTGFDIGHLNGAGAGAYIYQRANQPLIFGTNNATVLTLASTGAATFSSSVTASSFFESSDKTIKTLIKDNYSVKGIESITVKLYTKHGKEELGYFAQDVQGILPSAVTKGTNGLLNLSYREVLVAKVQSLEQRVKELETQLNLG